MTSVQALPDFLIIGAAKAGTTAVHAYLSQHPDVFVPTKKETNFFAYKDRTPVIIGPKDSEMLRQLLLKNPVTTMQNYQALFRTSKQHQVLGEASPRYLYYKEAPRLIKETLDDIKIIALLRNPIDRAYSHFLMNHQRGLEPEVNFVHALSLEQQRISDGWGWDWHYMQVGRYAEQLKRYFQLFPKEKIKIVFYENLSNDPLAMMEDLYRFIGVDDRFQANTATRYKVASTVGAGDGFLGRLAFATETTMLGRIAQKIVPKQFAQGLHRRVQDFVSGRGGARDVPVLDDTARKTAWSYVDNDVRELEKVFGQDLSHWNPNSDVSS